MIISYEGTRGKGKTLSCVREAYQHYLKGYDIYSNIKLNKKYFKEYKMYDKEDLISYVQGDKQFKKSFFIMDEIHVYLDSRMSMSKINTIISYFLLQTRKRNVRLGYTTQFFDQVEKRLRNLTEIRILCDYYDKGDKRIQHNQIFIKDTYELYHMDFTANPYYDTYDTDEIVNPFKDKAKS